MALTCVGVGMRSRLLCSCIEPSIPADLAVLCCRTLGYKPLPGSSAAQAIHFHAHAHASRFVRLAPAPAISTQVLPPASGNRPSPCVNGGPLPRRPECIVRTSASRCAHAYARANAARYTIVTPCPHRLQGTCTLGLGGWENLISQCRSQLQLHFA